MTSSSGISQANRARIERLHRADGQGFGVPEASEILGLDRARTARLLGYLARRGWLARVRRGFYVPVPLDARRSGEWVADSWVVADRLFSPCYIGGWSACQHWDLTEQVFRALLVVTARRVRERDLELQGIPFHLTVRSSEALFGTVSVWRDQTRVAVSDPSRTIVDVLDDPSLGGGIRTVADVLGEYMASQSRDDLVLIDYGDRLANRALFKRLGYLLELLGVDAPELVAACRERRSAGVIALDPTVKARGRIVRRWGLRDNAGLGSKV
ncbi:MAG: type IV toxin-antitoxin system AbiEi family antitoxin domain-containing protein [Solirubrobacterales bacterium]|nr:type IV toxin-antitoxin system AbiEi family antitoxin domain-containing protein [Solirubrobacterales bacterium]